MSSLQARASPPSAGVGALLVKQIAESLAQLIGSARPRRLARMSYPDEDKPEIDKKTKRRTGQMIPRDKYEDIRGDLTYRRLLDHANGEVTYSCTLDQGGLARAGVIDVDAGGKDALRALLGAAQQLGYTAFAIFVGGHGDHNGGHLWCIFDDWYSATAIKALMQRIAAEAQVATDEFWPQNQSIRLPFGYHQTKQTRGELLTQAGEVVDLDTNLQAGVNLVLSLSFNCAPPAIPEINQRGVSKKTQPDPERTAIRSASIERCSMQAIVSGTSPDARPAVEPTYRQIDTKAIGLAVRMRFNAEHDWPELLSRYGGVETRDGWACACGYPHAHATQLAITSQGKIVSFSPYCGWAPSKDSGKALDKFGFYIDREYSGNYQAAVEALARTYGLWVELPRHRNDQALVSELAVPRKDMFASASTTRREQRHQETRAALSDLYDWVAMRDLTFVVPVGIDPTRHDARARLLFVYLLDIAQTAGVLQVAPTNTQIAEALAMCKRYVIYAFRELEAAGLGKRTGGKGGLDRPNEAATWTFYRIPNLVCKPQQDAECILDNKESDLIPDHESCEGRAPRTPDPPDTGEPDSLDTWAWCDAPIGADDLAVLYEPTEPIASSTAASEPRVRRCGPWFYIADGLRCGTTHRTEAEAWAAWETLINPTLPSSVASAAPARFQIELNSDQPEQAASYMPDVEAIGGASYDESLDWTAQDCPMPSRSWHAALRPRELERWKRRPDLGGDWEVHEPSDGAQLEQEHIDIGITPEVVQPAVSGEVPQRKKPTQHQARTPKAHRRHQSAVTTRTKVGLGDELRTYRCTLKKHAGEAWLDQRQDKFVLIEAKVDRHATGPPAVTYVDASVAHAASRPRPHKLSNLEVSAGCLGAYKMQRE